LIAAAYCVFLYVSERQFLQAHAEVGELSGYVNYYRSLDEQDPRREAVEIVVAHRFRSIIQDAALWSHPTLDGFIDAPGRRLVEGFVESHPDVSQAQVAAAEARLEPARWEIRLLGWSLGDPLYSTPLPVMFFVVLGGVLLVIVVIPSLATAVLLGNSLLLHSLDLAIVTQDGAPASRLRVLWRNVALWMVVLLALGLLAFLVVAKKPRVIGLLVVYFGTIRIFLAERGLHDRLAGTWLVPR
jgi:hypothetical protein